MPTTIQVSQELVEELKKRKMYEKETYEEIIWDILEDTKELSEETKRRVAIAEQEIREGKVVPLSKIKQRLGM